jgi:hypothetical protein
MTNTHTTTSPLTPILTHDDITATALAAELISLADQADANATRYTAHPDDHGGIGSASRAYRTIATSLRWRAQMIVAGTEQNRPTFSRQQLDDIELGTRAAHALATNNCTNDGA